MERRLILFDIDGTLIDSGGAGRNALHRTLADTFDVPRDEVVERTAGVRFNGMTDPVIFRELVRALDRDNHYDDGDEAFEARYLVELREELARPNERRRMIPGIAELVATLDAHDAVTLGLVTGNIEAGARLKLEPFALNRYFPAGGFGSDDADRGKVARAAVDKLSTFTGTTFAADRVTVVGDTEQDVACARINGYRAVAVATGWTPREVLERATPDAILDTIDATPATLTALGVR